jgi:hypothetical protein
MIAGPSPTPPRDEPLRDADPCNPDTLRISPGPEAVAQERRGGFCLDNP